jgi:hypothetical protein
MFGVLIWLVLFVLCWPLAILALLLWPVIWLLSIPFRILGIGLEAVFELLRAVLFLPVRLLGGRRY